MLYIRADGNTEIGMGHVMRCLSVAEAAAELDCLHPPVFITADECCRSMIEEKGFRVIVLNTDYRDMMSELSQFEKLFCENDSCEKQDVLLVDSYQVSKEYYFALRKLVMVACFEDMGDPYPVDLLINYNIYAPGLEQNYQVSKWESNVMDCYPRRVLLGAAYIPLRKAFQDPMPYVIHDKVTNVIITTGGSDPYFATATIADVMLQDSEIVESQVHFNIISGPFNRFADQLKRKYQGHTNITVYENVKDMKSLLFHSDVVISATGSTIYEISSLGVPMIAFYFAENQRQGAEALEKLTEIVNAGCFAEDGNAVAAAVREALKHCIRDKAYRERLRMQETGLVDGKGAHRIAEQLLESGKRSDGNGEKPWL